MIYDVQQVGIQDGIRCMRSAGMQPRNRVPSCHIGELNSCTFHRCGKLGMPCILLTATSSDTDVMADIVMAEGCEDWRRSCRAPSVKHVQTGACLVG